MNGYAKKTVKNILVATKIINFISRVEEGKNNMVMASEDNIDKEKIIVFTILILVILSSY